MYVAKNVEVVKHNINLSIQLPINEKGFNEKLKTKILKTRLKVLIRQRTLFRY